MSTILNSSHVRVLMLGAATATFSVFSLLMFEAPPAHAQDSELRLVGEDQGNPAPAARDASTDSSNLLTLGPKEDNSFTKLFEQIFSEDLARLKKNEVTLKAAEGEAAPTLLKKDDNVYRSTGRNLITSLGMPMNSGSNRVTTTAHVTDSYAMYVGSYHPGNPQRGFLESASQTEYKVELGELPWEFTSAHCSISTQAYVNYYNANGSGIIFKNERLVRDPENNEVSLLTAVEVHDYDNNFETFNFVCLAKR